MPKQRLDQCLLELGLAPSKNQAQSLIMTGQVKVNDQRITKAGTGVDVTKDHIDVQAKACPYVSRGGLKLAHALEYFDLDCQGVIALDVGASTGGFTDCLLQAGAAHVYAVDVGYGQLDGKLRAHPNVTNWERTNGRQLSPNDFPEDARPNIGVTDVSFISLKKILPALTACLDPCAENSWVLALLKPQFECLDYFSPKEARRFDGVVRDDEQRDRVKAGVLEDLQALLPHWQLVDTCTSPIQGPKGNVEFLTLWCPKASGGLHTEQSRQ